MPRQHPLGAAAIDDDLLAGLEGRDVIRQLADDLYRAFTGPAARP
jgi:hypothetical protein